MTTLELYDKAQKCNVKVRRITIGEAKKLVSGDRVHFMDGTLLKMVTMPYIGTKMTRSFATI